MAESEWTVDGFTFNNGEDAKLAKAELNRIDQLETKIDHKNPHLVHAVYEKAIANNLFKTPVGICYLKQLQNEIKKSPLIQKEITDIPVSVVTEEKLVKEVNKNVKKEVNKVTTVSKRMPQRASLYLNVILVIIVIALFYITLTSPNPNAINYEYNLQNKYASWNEELNQREQIIREKEKELGVH